METRLSLKGQITLPVAVRNKLRLKTGDVLRLEIRGDGSVILSRQPENQLHRDTALDLLRETAGTWEAMPETGEQFVHQLRTEDSKRLERLGID